MIFGDMTRSEKTQREYLEIGGRLLQRYERYVGRSWRDDPIAFVEWFADQRRYWRKATWNRYKQCVKTVLIEEGAPYEAIQYLDDNDLLPPSFSGKSQHHQPVKRISQEVLHSYLDVLSKSKSPLAHLLAAFLLVNTEIGLRPIEWGQASLQGTILSVRNAKSSNGRSNGRFRQIILDDDLVDKVRGAFYLRDLAIERYGTWSDVVKRLRQMIKSIRHNHKLPQLHLYSTRHQFAANAKSAGLSPEDIAMLMGHGSTKTARASYGAKRVGRGGLLVSPLVVNTEQEIFDHGEGKAHMKRQHKADAL